MVAVHGFAGEHDIAGDPGRYITVDVVYDQSQRDQAINSINAMRELVGGNDQAAGYGFRNAERVAEPLFCEKALDGVTFEAGSLTAYEFVIGMLKLA